MVLLMEIVAVPVPAIWQPLAGTLYVTVYVPGVEAATLICPVEGLMLKPVPALKVPPLLNPVPSVGDSGEALLHTGLV